MADKDLTHDEVWDDSVLVNSWNDAFEEYKKYHSLAAEGKAVEVQNTNSKSKSGPSAPNDTSNPPSAPVNFAAPPINPTTFIGPTAPPGASASTSQSATSVPPVLIGLPQSFLGNSQNDDMKNIMMSWYYAGYYTGLYEGQQKAWAQMQEMQAHQQ